MVCEGRLKMSFRRPLVWLERGSLERLHADSKFCVMCRRMKARRAQSNLLHPKTPLDPILPTAQAGAVFRYIVP